MGTPLKTLGDAVAAAKAKPGTLNFASPGNGTVAHLTSEMFQKAAGIQTQHVPYKGAIPAITDLLGGRIQFFIGGVNSLLPHIKDGKLRALAGAAGQRYQAFPELPAMAETVPGVALDVWLGIFMPAGVPKDIVAKANADIARVLQLPEVKANLAGQGIETAVSTPEALTATIRDDHAR
jgi:tripartite-type tricarboxylate transporter receptor subunit TctC